jgi:hypothetical protein
MLFGDSYGEEFDDARCFFGISMTLNFRLSPYTMLELLIPSIQILSKSSVIGVY